MRKSMAVPLLLGIISLSAQVYAAEYPSRRVDVIVPFASGGAVDVVGRLMSGALAEASNQPFVVVNKPGAGGIPAMQEVARATPDGSVLGVGSSGTLTISPILFAKMNFDTLRDVEPIVWFANSGLVLVARADLKANNLAELIELSKKNPGSLNMASAGTGSIIHLTGEYVQSILGVRWTHVPYKGSAPALTDMMGGRVDVMTDSIPSAAPYIKSGKLKAIAVTSAKRAAELPDVPTMWELGYKNVDVGILYGVVAAKSTPNAVVSYINTTLNNSLKNPEMIKRLAALGFEPAGGSPEQFRDRIAKELTRWKKVIHDSHVEVQ